MQNKANFNKAIINAKFYITKDYENYRFFRTQKNKAKQSQFFSPALALASRRRRSLWRSWVAEHTDLMYNCWRQNLKSGKVVEELRGIKKVVFIYPMPKTSAIEYKAGFFPTSHSAARSAPRAKVSLL